MTTSARRTSLAAEVAPAAFVLLWSTGFIGSKYGFPYAEPLTFLALRMLITVALLGAYVLVRRAALPTRAQAVHAAVAGVLLHAAYLSFTWYAMYLGMPAGIAALIIGLQPIVTAVLAGVVGERVTPRAWLGLALGLVGVVLVVSEKLAVGSAGATVATLTLIALALASSTAGTLYQKRHGAGIPLLGGTVVQYAATLAVVGPAALLLERGEVAWTPEFTLALAWLVLALSVGAVLLLLWLIRTHTTARVNSLYYLVPPITAVMAYLLFGEALGPAALAGMAVSGAGVWIVAGAERHALRAQAGAAP